MHRLFAVIAAGGALALSSSTIALAANPHSPANPTGPATGQPNQSCQSFSATTRPGNSYLSPGAPFNEGAGVNSVNGGTGGNAYTNAGAPSQYDVACFQASQH